MKTCLSVALLVVVGTSLVDGRGLPASPVKNERPIIGILAVEMDQQIQAAVMATLQSRSRPPRHTSQDAQTAHELDNGSGETSQETPDYSPSDANSSIEAASTEITSSENTDSSEPDQSVKINPSVNPQISNDPRDVDVTPRQDVPKTYIAASYVKFIEAAGARVVPILLDQDQEYYDNILASINGVLFPGGAVPVDETSGYGRAGKLIYDAAVRMNRAGDVFPLWGTCLGFEMLMNLAAGGQDTRISCKAQNTANRIKLTRDSLEGNMFRLMPKRLLKALMDHPVTANFHHFCVTPKNFSSMGVGKVFRSLAHSCDRTGVEYVAAVEGRDLPFYAVQFHPEKSPFEWTVAEGHEHIPHTREAVQLASYFADFFVSQARRSRHQFSNVSVEEASLIYRFSPTYTGTNSPLEQVYLF